MAIVPPVGPYRLLHEIGRGGQGIVYLAEDTRVKRRVALKVLKNLGVISGAALVRFRREAEAASRLEHPGICGMHEAQLDGEVPYIAMRYVEGVSLAEKISAAKGSDTDCTWVDLPEVGKAPRVSADSAADAGRTPSGPTARADVIRVLEVVEQAARAVHAAHDAGVIHRDLKPGNIMVTPEGSAVVMDFGLAHLEDENTVTRTGELFGTPAYMSPEQLLTKLVKIDRRTDVWSLGVTLYECLTLKRPFDAPTRDAVYHSIQTREPPDPRSLNPGVPADLTVVVRCALEKDRDRRYPTALEFAEDLRRVREYEPIHAKAPGPWLRVVRWSQRRRALAAALAVIAVLAGIGIFVSWSLAKERERGRQSAAAVSTERSEKETAIVEKQASTDLAVLRHLVTRADSLWPARPAMVPGMSQWLAEAVAVRSRLARHRETLDGLRAASRSVAEPRDASARRETLEQLVRELEAFADPDPARGLLASVTARRTLAETLDRETLGNYETRWADAVRSVADRRECPKYDGLSIRPQLGLIPIARDSNSGLWEFVDLQTAAPGSNPVPQHGDDGRLAVTEGTGIVFVLLPGGTFTMGAVKPGEQHAAGGPNVDPDALANESPVTTVALAPYFLSKYEMTQGQWLKIAGRNPSQFPAGRKLDWPVDLRHPVEQVTWKDCETWLERMGLALPTEAQWEYAARAGTASPWWTATAEGLATAANLADAYCKTHGGQRSWAYEAWDDRHAIHAPVGSFAPNPFGLHDVLGNVWEWCRDEIGSYTSPVDAGSGLRHHPDATQRVLRGGAFNNERSHARAAYRYGNPPDTKSNVLGVRPARALDP